MVVRGEDADRPQGWAPEARASDVRRVSRRAAAPSSPGSGDDARSGDGRVVPCPMTGVPSSRSDTSEGSRHLLAAAREHKVAGEARERLGDRVVVTLDGDRCFAVREQRGRGERGGARPERARGRPRPRGDRERRRAGTRRRSAGRRPARRSRAPRPSTAPERATRDADRGGGSRARRGSRSGRRGSSSTSHAETVALAERLEQAGLAPVRRAHFLVVGAASEGEAEALAERLRAEAPRGRAGDRRGQPRRAVGRAAPLRDPGRARAAERAPARGGAPVQLLVYRFAPGEGFDGSSSARSSVSRSAARSACSTPLPRSTLTRASRRSAGRGDGIGSMLVPASTSASTPTRRRPRSARCGDNDGIPAAERELAASLTPGRRAGRRARRARLDAHAGRRASGGAAGCRSSAASSTRQPWRRSSPTSGAAGRRLTPAVFFALSSWVLALAALRDRHRRDVSPGSSRGRSLRHRSEALEHAALGASRARSSASSACCSPSGSRCRSGATRRAARRWSTTPTRSARRTSAPRRCPSRCGRGRSPRCAPTPTRASASRDVVPDSDAAERAAAAGGALQRDSVVARRRRAARGARRQRVAPLRRVAQRDDRPADHARGGAAQPGAGLRARAGDRRRRRRPRRSSRSTSRSSAAASGRSSSRRPSSPSACSSPSTSTADPRGHRGARRAADVAARRRWRCPRRPARLSGCVSPDPGDASHPAGWIVGGDQ